MEKELEGGVCGGNLWKSSRNLFGPSPCSSAVNGGASFGWFNQGGVVDMKTATSVSDDSAGSATDGGSSMILEDVQKPQQLYSNGNISISSTLQMMGICTLSASTSTDDWNQDLLHDSGRSQENYSQILKALNSSMNCRQKIADNWSTTASFSSDSSMNSFKHLDQSFPVDQQQSDSFTSFPLNSVSYSYTSSLLQNLFDTDSQPHGQSLLHNQATDYSSPPNYQMNSTEFFPKPIPMLKPSLLKQQPASNFQFINNTPFWNATAAAPAGDLRASFLPSSQPQLIPSCPSKVKLKPHNVSSKIHKEKAGETDSVGKKVRNESAFKRPRIETPSPLPTFKVRKEKLGDRVTALQQLVSPFGKTDTASVLHEAIEYIKLLHDQVTVLSTPYLKNGSPPIQCQKGADNIKNQEEPMEDLRSRGLCLVPVSSTFPMAAETTADFWTPTFGGSFR